MEKKETEIEKKNDAASKFENDPKRNEETKRARGKNDEEGGKGKRKVTRSASISLLLIGRSALASWPLIGHRSTAPKWQNKTLVFIFSSSVAFFSIDIAPYNPRKKKRSNNRNGAGTQTERRHWSNAAESGSERETTKSVGGTAARWWVEWGGGKKGGGGAAAAEEEEEEEEEKEEKEEEEEEEEEG